MGNRQTVVPVSSPARPKYVPVGTPALLLIALLLATVARAGTEIPPDKRIVATVVGALVPTTQPMHMPTDVAVDSKDNVYVADGANNRILRFAPDGRGDGEIAQADDKPLDRSVGLGVDAQDRLWIADTGNRRIVQVSRDGTSSTIEPPKLDNAARFNPTDVAITADGRRAYVVDNDNHRIFERNNVTGQWTTLGAFGRNVGQFQWPFMVCVGKDEYVYVSEAIGARVQRISPQDRWAGEIGRWGVELGQLYRPKGIVADKSGRLFVSDSTLGVVQVFGERGTVDGVLTNAEGLPLRFKHPMGLALDSNGQLYVVELAANRVAIVKIEKAKP
jgi:DNA-binding beta-propeller fold protein YncE